MLFTQQYNTRVDMQWNKIVIQRFLVIRHGIYMYKQQPPFDLQMCTDIRPRTLSVPRSQQFSKGTGRGKLWSLRKQIISKDKYLSISNCSWFLCGDTLVAKNLGQQKCLKIKLPEIFKGPNFEASEIFAVQNKTLSSFKVVATLCNKP